MRFFMALFLFTTLNLTACVTTRVGDFAKAPTDVYQTMVNDTVARLVVLYPPARTCFQLHQRIRDPFGALLVKSLRLKGYSVIESRKGAQGIPLAYVVDSPKLPARYRVSVMMGGQSISRAYAFNQGHVYPEGSWTHKE